MTYTHDVILFKISKCIMHFSCTFYNIWRKNSSFFHYKHYEDTLEIEFVYDTILNNIFCVHGKISIYLEIVCNLFLVAKVCVQHIVLFLFDFYMWHDVLLLYDARSFKSKYLIISSPCRTHASSNENKKHI